MKCKRPSAQSSPSELSHQVSLGTFPGMAGINAQRMPTGGESQPAPLRSRCRLKGFGNDAGVVQKQRGAGITGEREFINTRCFRVKITFK